MGFCQARGRFQLDPTASLASAGVLVGSNALFADNYKQERALVITNAKALTVDAQDRIAEAFICENGKFTFVGSTTEALARKPSGARVIDFV